jgi:hypothetical protein
MALIEKGEARMWRMQKGERRRKKRVGEGGG